MDYTVWAPAYSHASGGVRALYELCDRICESEYSAYPRKEYIPGTIAVYPEVIRGNLFKAAKVVRWALNAPGYLGGEDRYDPNELLFTWDKRFVDLPSDRILKVDIIDSRFYDYGKDRSGDCFWIGKGRVKGYIPGREVEGMEEITPSYPSKREDLVDMLNSKVTLFSYDDCTALNLEALLCGCKVVLLPEQRELFLKDLLLHDDYKSQLSNFIRITQEWSHE